VDRAVVQMEIQQLPAVQAQRDRVTPAVHRMLAVQVEAVVELGLQGVQEQVKSAVQVVQVYHLVLPAVQ
jgi:hypothetical protein